MVLVVEQPVLSVTPQMWTQIGGTVMVKTQPGWSHGHISTLIWRPDWKMLERCDHWENHGVPQQMMVSTLCSWLLLKRTDVFRLISSFHCSCIVLQSNQIDFLWTRGTLFYHCWVFLAFLLIPQNALEVQVTAHYAFIFSDKRTRWLLRSGAPELGEFVPSPPDWVSAPWAVANCAQVLIVWYICHNGRVRDSSL